MTSQFLIDKLAASGLLPDDVDATDVASPFGETSGGIFLPYYTPAGAKHPHMHRVRRSIVPPGLGKYTQPSTEELVRAGHPDSTATMPYLNPYILGGMTWASFGAMQRKKILIVEGELKAACAGKHLICAAIGIPGCEGGVRRDKRGIAHVHPIIKALLQPGDLVEIALDGDILTNRSVNRAGGTLRRALLRLGVKVRFVLLPEPPPGVGAGLDDWLMRIDAADRQRAFAALPRVDGSEFDEDWASVADFFELSTNKDGIATNLVTNIRKIMQGHEYFATRYYLDVMRGNIYRDGPRPAAFCDAFIFDEQCWFETKFGMKVSKQGMLDALRWMATQPRWHRNLVLESLPAWDGTSRLETMFIVGLGAPDTPHVRAVGLKWLVSAMARANAPGCQVDTMLVLVGKQGIGKSRALEALAGGLYVATHAQVQDKDFTLAMDRGWVIDLAELSSMNHSDATHIKGIITNATDHIRPPYAATIEEKPRHSVIVGTTNEERFLRDQTGNRRFWPIACGKVNIKWLKETRGQLLAEAQERYLAGHDWWDMPDDTESEQEARMEVGAWDAELVRILNSTDYSRVIAVNGQCYRFISSEELLMGLGLEPWKRKSHMYRDLKSAMDRVGGQWEKYLCRQPISVAGGAIVPHANGYRLPTNANATATVVDLHPPPAM